MSIFVLLLGLGAVVGTMAVIVIVTIALWPRQGKLGINLAHVHCPRCAEPMPPVRIPKTASQMLWGGWTCPQCGCKMNKYGTELPSGSG